MKKQRFTETQILFALQQADSGTPVSEIVRKMGISEPTFYRWKKKYAGLGAHQIGLKNVMRPGRRGLGNECPK